MAFFNTGQSGSSQGGGGTGGGLDLPFVNTFANLPTTGNSVDDLIYVRVATGTPLINRRPAGIYRWTGSAWVQSGLTSQIIAENTSTFIGLLEREYTPDYIYYQLDLPDWQINRYTNTETPVKTVARLADNPAVLHPSNAWANRTVINYI